MYIKIILNSLKENKGQKLLSLLTIFLASLLLSCMLNITISIGNKVAKELRSYGSNILVLPKGAGLSIDLGFTSFRPFANKNYLDEKTIYKIKDIFWRNNINALAPFLSTKQKINGKITNVVGTYFNKGIKIDYDDEFYAGVKELFKFWKVNGSFIKDGSLTSVMVGKTLASQRGWKLGDELIIGKYKVKIKGIISRSKDYDDDILCSLLLAQKLSGLEGKYEKALVSALTIPENDLALKARHNVESLNQVEYDKWYCTAYVSSMAFQIEENYKGSVTKIVTAVSDAEGAIVKKIQKLMGVVSLIALIVSSIAIYSLLNLELFRRRKEIGLLKALGASGMQIFCIFLSEGVLIAIVGGLLGFLASIGVSQMLAFVIFKSQITISLSVLVLAVSFSVLAVFLACFASIKKIDSLSVSEVLYGR